MYYSLKLELPANVYEPLPGFDWVGWESDKI